MPKPLSLTVATANVLHAHAPTKPLGGWDFGPYADLDVCGFQEADSDEWHKAAPPWFGRRLFAPPGPLRENTITWSDRWTVVRRGWHMTHKGLAGISPHRGYTLVVLQDAESGETAAVLDSHYVSAAWSRLPKREKAWRKARWLEHHAQLCAEVKSLLADPDIDHVIVLGDFNRNATRTNGYSIPGLRLVGDSKVRRGIDHIWVSPGLRAESVRKWPKRGSDHRPVVAALTSAPVKPQPKPPKPAPKPDPEVPVTDDRYELTTHDGKTVDRMTDQALDKAEKRLGYPLTIVQGSYHRGVGASAGTHDGGGVVDLAPWDADRKVRVLRDLGFAAWYRPRLVKNGRLVWNSHIHAVLIGNEKMSEAARRQVVAYKAGRNGLKDNGPDPSPRPAVIHPYRYDPPPPPSNVSLLRKDIEQALAVYGPKINPKDRPAADRMLKAIQAALDAGPKA